MINRNETENLLKEGAREMGIKMETVQAEKLLLYMELLLEWNERINLTAIENERDIVIKHFLDSIAILPYINKRVESLIDIGTGAGFPGIPIKVMNPSLNITLLDSLEKRTRFLGEIIASLELKGIEVVHGRAEDMGAKGGLREMFDCATARAVAALPVLLEYCLPFVKNEGVFIAMKGSSTEEIKDSVSALDILGGKIECVNELTLPFSDFRRNIIIVKKFRQTPTKYPRKAGKPSRNPLI